MPDVMFSSKRVGRPARLVEPNLVKQLYTAGLSFREIARKTGLGYGTVRRAFLGIQTTSQMKCLAVMGARDSRKAC